MIVTPKRERERERVVAVMATSCEHAEITDGRISPSLLARAGTGGNQLPLVCLIFDARGNGEGGVSPTIAGDHQNRITDYTAVVVEKNDEDIP